MMEIRWFNVGSSIGYMKKFTKLSRFREWVNTLTEEIDEYVIYNFSTGEIIEHIIREGSKIRFKTKIVTDSEGNEYSVFLSH